MPSLGFGLERLGLPSLRNPKTSLVLILLVSLLAGIGLLKLKATGSLSELFRSDSAVFRNYEKLNRLFPTSEYDVMALISGKDLMRPGTIDDIRNIQLELEFAKGVRGIVSMFTMRGKLDETGYAPPLFPADIPRGKEFRQLLEKVRQHPQIEGKLLSLPDDNGEQVVMMVISLEKGSTDTGVLKGVIDGLNEIIREQVKTAGLRYQLTGVPVMQLEIRQSIRHDRVTFNLVGFTLGVLISLFFFRRPTLVFISSICPAFAVLWIMGILGWVGQPINTFINVLPPLIMVIALSDAMHMVFSIQKGLRSGQSRFEAVRHAVLTVGPACVLTSLTTTIALLSMALADSADIRAFGLAAAGGTLMAFVAVITLVPTLSMLLIRDEKRFLERDKEGFNPLLWLEHVCRKLGDFVLSRWRFLTAAGLAVAIVFTFFYSQLEVRYRLSDQVPDTDTAMQAMQMVDRDFSGAQKISIMVEWPEGVDFSSLQVLEAMAGVHKILQNYPQIGGVTSLESIRLETGGGLDEKGRKLFREYVEKLPDNLKDHYLNEKARTALVSGQIGNLEAAQMAPVIRQMEADLRRLGQAYPHFRFTIAGLAVVSALQSNVMIEQLNQGLIIAVIIVIVLLGLAFRSLDAALLSIVPNLFPIVTVGTFLYLSGEGLQFASVMGLTVAFGLAVDDTIHFLGRYELEKRNRGSTRIRVRETMVHVGPVLVLTTMVLLCGLSVTSLSSLPVTRLFGQLSMATLAAALVADLLILPAIILATRRYRRDIGQRDQKGR